MTEIDLMSYPRIIILTIFLLAIGCSFQNYSLIHLHQAETLSHEKKFDEAITEYRLHIQTLQDLDDKESWENPSFYRLKIGDLLLEKGDAQGALTEFLLADKEGIEKDSVSYRLRAVARWYEEKGDFAIALELLNRFRERDPLLFNALLDEIARKQADFQFNKRNY